MADLDALKSMLTVYSAQEGIDPAAAPQRLRQIAEPEPGSSGPIPLVASQRKTFAFDVESRHATAAASAAQR